MKRRLTLATATMGDPPVLFIDEATTGIDPVNKRRIWDTVLNLKRDRVIVLTTHSMGQKQNLCSEVPFDGLL
jgi:ABC-type multidrug transport system ATPase subunit